MAQRLPENVLQLRAALARLPDAQRQELLAKARDGLERDPRHSPAWCDVVVASAGGNRALYRKVETCIDGVVYFYHGHRINDYPKVGQMPLDKYRTWAQRAVVERRAHTQMYVRGVGWCLDHEVADAMSMGVESEAED